MKTKAMFAEGTRVVLQANPDEGWPEQRGTYDGPSGPMTHVVTVDRKYRTSRRDDGLREVTADQLSREKRQPPTMIMVDVPDEDFKKTATDREWQSFLRECARQVRLRRARA